MPESGRQWQCWKPFAWSDIQMNGIKWEQTLYAHSHSLASGRIHKRQQPLCKIKYKIFFFCNFRYVCACACTLLTFFAANWLLTISASFELHLNNVEINVGQMLHPHNRLWRRGWTLLMSNNRNGDGKRGSGRWVSENPWEQTNSCHVMRNHRLHNVKWIWFTEVGPSFRITSKSFARPKPKNHCNYYKSDWFHRKRC